MNTNTVILEIRPGVGGDEARIWATDLLRMYLKYAASKSWKTTLIDENVVKISGVEVFNLLKNASHVIDKEKGKIIVSVDKNNDDKVAIKITDNGPGIPQKVLNKLFTPFFTTKEPGKGTGLGLALVKIMTERNNGIIKVESEEGKGTTFTLIFKGEG